MADLSIERIGGIAGFGLPGSRIASRGQIDLHQLTAVDVTAIESLFSLYAKTAKSKTATLPRDRFHYRISRSTTQGTEQIEVPEEHVPAALVRCVKDELL
jgi:hypothetical protein